VDVWLLAINMQDALIFMFRAFLSAYRTLLSVWVYMGLISSVHKSLLGD